MMPSLPPTQTLNQPRTKVPQGFPTAEETGMSWGETTGCLIS
ncbi:unnamed protein product [Gulo gulo]|uniref:Uncharacterized protein n=1 Tax=Gulo gulo TaxID=48420 RepID=A0A9X9Q2R8_GULGU|nr:unnamed protein product [Gulo gulo]